MKASHAAGLALAAAAGVYWMNRPAKTATTTSEAARVKARSLIQAWEGFSPTVYRDAAGLPTIGYGHLLTKGETYPQGITRMQALALLDKDMRTAVTAVDKGVTVPTTDNQRAALISLAFNIGAGAFGRSTLLRRLNAGDAAGAADQFAAWNKAGGRVIQGLVNRRAAEKQLFLS